MLRACALALLLGSCASTSSEDGGTRDASPPAETPSGAEGGAPREDASPRDATADPADAPSDADPSTPAPPGSSDGAPADARADVPPDAGTSDAGIDANPEPNLVAPPGYPSGPWGNDVGDVVAPLVWTGHVNEDGIGLSTDEPLSDLSMDDLRRSGKPYALVHLSEFLCPGCNNAAGDLATLGPSLVAAGGVVVEVLGTNRFFSPASLDDVATWIATHDLTVTTVTDAAGYELSTFEAFGVRETAIIVDLTSMRIVWKMNGDVGGDLPSSINDAASELLALLGG